MREALPGCHLSTRNVHRLQLRLRFVTRWPLICTILLFAATGCGAQRSTNTTTHSPTTQAPAQTPSDTPVLFFPQQAAVDGDRVVMEALTAGTLLLVNSCLRLAHPNHPSYLVVWPPDVTLDTTQEFIQVRTKTGQVVAQVGGMVQMSGGTVDTISQVQAKQMLSQPLPAECPGPYWIVGDEIGPSTR